MVVMVNSWWRTDQSQVPTLVYVTEVSMNPISDQSQLIEPEAGSNVIRDAHGELVCE